MSIYPGRPNLRWISTVRRKMAKTRAVGWWAPVPTWGVSENPTQTTPKCPAHDTRVASATLARRFPPFQAEFARSKDVTVFLSVLEAPQQGATSSHPTSPPSRCNRRWLAKPWQFLSTIDKAKQVSVDASDILFTHLTSLVFLKYSMYSSWKYLLHMYKAGRD